MKIRGGLDSKNDTPAESSMQEDARELAGIVEQMNQGSVQLDQRPALSALSSKDGLNVIKLPLLSTEESSKLRKRLTEKQPGALHERALRNISAPNAGAMKKAVGGWAFRAFPILDWAPKLDRSTVFGDIIAGITVAVMLIPQSMSYADIAGLQYKYGMYAGFMPTLVYALMGTSRQLAVGPVAMVSLLVSSGLDGILTPAQCPAMYCPDPTVSATCYPSQFPELRAAGTAPTAVPYECGAEYAKMAFVLSFLVGCLQLGAGVFKAGYLVAFLGHPVVSGFTSGAAIIIGLSQVKYILGYDIPKSPYVQDTLKVLFENIDQFQYMPFILGVIWIATLIGLRKGAQKYPENKFLKIMKPLAPLTLCVVGIALMYAAPVLKEDQFKVKVVGSIPGGVDDLWSAPELDLSQGKKLMAAALSIAVIGFMESISIAKALAISHGYKLVAGQELVALGAANIVGSCFSAYPVTGSFSRSAVNNSVGAKTALSGAVTGSVMLLTLTLLTPALTELPKFCLGAIVISSVINLFAYKECIHLWTVKKSDWLCWMAAFLGTLFAGVELGLIIAISLSLLVVIYESVRPQMSVLWSIPDTKYYRHVKQPELGNFIRNVLVVRVGASMYFANVANIQSKLENLVEEMEGSEAIGDVKYIVLDMTPVITVDASAIHALEDMNDMFKKRGVRMCFANCNTRVFRTMSFAHFQEHIGNGWFLPEVHLAVKFCIKHQAGRNLVLRSWSKDGVAPDLEGLSHNLQGRLAGMDLGVSSQFSAMALNPQSAITVPRPLSSITGDIAAAGDIEAQLSK